MECELCCTVCIEVQTAQLSGEYSMDLFVCLLLCGNIHIWVFYFCILGYLYLLDVGVVSYFYMVSLVLCPSLLQIHPAGSLFQVFEYLLSLSLEFLG